jgi:hypothetical protein
MANKMNATALKKIIENSTERFQENENQIKIVTDFHITVDNADGIVKISDDDNTELASGIVSDLISANEEATTNLLQTTLNEMDKENKFNNTNIYKPFSFLLEDNDGETIAELLIIDDDNIFVNDELLKGLGQELDDFFADLMKED